MKIPMTPRGVEHLIRMIFAVASKHVKIPMTPRGVEHLLGENYTGATVSEDSYDAERR